MPGEFRFALLAKGRERLGVVGAFHQRFELLLHRARSVGGRQIDSARRDTFGGLDRQGRARCDALGQREGSRHQIGHGCMSDKDTGLSAFGHEVVERLNANRIMVDLSHSGTQTCLEAARVSKAPISINHTGCRALTDLPRNKSDEELRLVASKGGFVGIYFMPFLKSDGHPNAEDVVAHIEHAIDICGEDHVGIGTDGSATPIDDLAAYRTYLAKQVEDRRKSGLGATGERADSYPFVVDLRGVDQFRKLSQLLKARGHTETRIEKILGLNFLRYARDVWDA